MVLWLIRPLQDASVGFFAPLPDLNADIGLAGCRGIW